MKVTLEVFPFSQGIRRKVTAKSEEEEEGAVKQFSGHRERK
jgi:hypothetical protein